MIKILWFIGPIFIVSYLSFWLLKRYISKNVNHSQIEILLIPWFNLSILLLSDFLIPIDVYSQGSIFLYYLWFALYIVQFIICWFLLPCLISYQSLTYSNYSIQGPLRQLYGSIIQNLKFYGISIIVLLLAYIFSVMILSIRSIWPIIISLCHIYSLSFTLILLSMGLIIVPRKLYHSLFINESKLINHYYILLSRQNDELNDTKLYLLDHSINILQSKPLNNGDVEFNQLLKLCQEEVEQRMDELKYDENNNNNNNNNNSNNSSNNDINYFLLDGYNQDDSENMFVPIKNIDKLNKEWNKFITNFYTIQYHKYQINQLIHCLAKQSSINLDSSLNLNYYSWSYKRTMVKIIRTILLFIFLAITTALSLCIILLELLPVRVSKWIFWNKVSSFKLFIPITLLIILIYNKLISLYSMTIIKFQHFHLTPNGQSNPINLFYFTLYGNRLLFPLYFNTMTILPETIITKTQFNKILYNQIQMIPFVNWLNKWLPPIFIIIISMSYYDNKLKWKILNKFISEDTLYQIFGWFNLDDYIEENDLSTGSIFNNRYNNIHDGIGDIDNERVSISTNNRFSINSNASVISTTTIPTENNNNNNNNNNTNNNGINIPDMNDIAYSLQDGKYLFERAMNKSNANRYTDNIDFNSSNILYRNNTESNLDTINDIHNNSKQFKVNNYLDDL